eukprot:1874150-Pyramimonas_sp.AAC.1
MYRLAMNPKAFFRTWSQRLASIVNLMNVSLRGGVARCIQTPVPGVSGAMFCFCPASPRFLSLARRLFRGQRWRS